MFTNFRSVIFCIAVWYLKVKTKTWRNINFTVVLHEYETLTLIFKEELRLKAFQNRVLG